MKTLTIFRWNLNIPNRNTNAEKIIVRHFLINPHILNSRIPIIRGLFLQGPIDREIRTTVRIRWSFAQMCCAMSLVCPSIVTHRTCQFWAHSEPVNMPKRIESPVKCGVRAVIRFLYSEQVTRNVVLRYCTSSWQYSAAYCSCKKRLLKRFRWEVYDHPPSSARTWLPVIFISFLVRKGRRKTTFWQWAADQRSVENWLKAQAAGFYEEGIGMLVPRQEKCLRRSVDYVEK